MSIWWAASLNSPGRVDVRENDLLTDYPPPYDAFGSKEKRFPGSHLLGDEMLVTLLNRKL